MRTTAFEAAATTGGSASEEAAPAGEASTAGTSEFVGQVGKTEMHPFSIGAILAISLCIHIRC